MLDFVKELSKNGASEVAGQTAGHVVSDEGLNDSLSEKRTSYYIDLQLCTTLFGECNSTLSNWVIARPNQAVDLIVVRRLGVRVSVLSQRFTGIPVAS